MEAVAKIGRRLYILDRRLRRTQEAVRLRWTTSGLLLIT
jgi:hypothetical protein